MHTIVSSLRGRFALGATLALLGGAFALPSAASAAQFCKGSIKAGPKDPLGLSENPVAYRFACGQPISSYSILLDQEIDTFETEVFGTSRFDGNVIAADAFSCNGDLPGYGINCVGNSGGDFNVLAGTFDLSTAKICAEPRPDPLLIVTTVTVAKNPDGTAKIDAKGNASVKTETNGPFDLGRPHGCPKSARGGKTRIPRSNDTPAPDQGDPVTAPVRRRSS